MKLENCRCCGSEKLEIVIDLGEQPWGNDFRKSPENLKVEKYPLTVVFCEECKLVQLNFTVPKEKMFTEHTYVSGSTNTLRKHFFENALEVMAHWSQNSLKDKPYVLDIGSNDGTQLQEFQKLGANIQGVESAGNIAIIAQEAGIPTDNAFFNLNYAERTNKKYDIINASGVFFHLEELHSATQAVKALLADDGIFVVQFIYLKRMIENLAFDQIYHEHLLYYNFATLNNLLKRHGLEIFHACEKPIHGGSGIAYITHRDRRDRSPELEDILLSEEADGYLTKEKYVGFMNEILDFKRLNRDFIEYCLNGKKIIYGLGAPVKGNTLLNFFEITNEEIHYLTEINPLREGMIAPGSNIPVKIEDDTLVHPDVYYVLAWNFKDEILLRYQDLIDDGVEFYFPVTIQNEVK